MSNPKRPVSPVEEFIKAFHEMSARYGRSELWYDYIDMHAIALANTCDLRCRDAREERYKCHRPEIREKTVQQFAVLTAINNDRALGKSLSRIFLAPFTIILGLSQKPSRAIFHAVQCRTDDGTHKHAGFSCSGQVPYPAGERPVLWCRVSASGGVQCDARAVGIP